MILLAFAFALAAQPTPPGYRQWEKDVCAETDRWQSPRACRRAYRRQLRSERRIVTVEDICLAAQPDRAVITDERRVTIACPEETAR
jgi:hypothetical protein